MTTTDASPAATRPASFIQERIANLAIDGRDADTCVVAWSLKGTFDEARWERAVGRLATRHETLRSRLVAIDGAVLQHVEPRAALTAERFDLRTQAPHSRGRLLAEAAEAAAAPIALGAAPLARLAIYTLASDERLVVWSFSHAIWDASCDRVLACEFAELYGSDADPAPLPLPFHEVVRQERRPPTAAIRRRSAQLARLPAPEPAGEAASAYVATIRPAGTVTPAALRALSELGRVAGCGAGVVLLAAYVRALGALLGRDRLTVGLLDANREQPGRQQLLACIVNVLLIPIETAGDGSIGDLVADVRDAVYDAYDHRAPLEHQLAAFDVVQRRGEVAVCDTLFNYQPAEVRPPRPEHRCDERLTLRPTPLQPGRQQMAARGPWAGARLCLCAVATADGGLAMWFVRDQLRHPDEWLDALVEALRRSIATALGITVSGAHALARD